MMVLTENLQNNDGEVGIDKILQLYVEAIIGESGGKQN